ncbi:hypothetical protein FZX01_03730 [Listeria monocytogenes]|nr:hypothetical protein FZX01_03730 [Listeria monocytogenes]
MGKFLCKKELVILIVEQFLIFSNIFKRRSRVLENKEGFLVEICGIDGSGKTTQAEEVVKILKSQNKKASYVHPFKHKEWASKELKEIAKNYQTSFNSMYSNDVKVDAYTIDLIYNTFNEIQTRILNGEIVVVDKYKMDSEIYIPLFVENKTLFDYVKNILPEPQIKFFLNVDPSVAYSRIQARDPGKNNLRESLEYMRKANMEFLIRAKENRVITINGQRTIAEITTEIYENIEGFVGEWYGY